MFIGLVAISQANIIKKTTKAEKIVAIESFSNLIRPEFSTYCIGRIYFFVGPAFSLSLHYDLTITP